ncbi:putative O-methyltransferase [Talaromyces proteolyticus]|uniref:O-methyltransferase n=1 Tax=Talaromyces proteolyticus TaxID=1131652 RepID=A0AAD4PWZ5_9EURO|nr:putative O-methyltransferase [Talaromyces proteolyticus]KAH8692412.1 putative O-methyltransferase [Talaromyces proteolyticus]
MESNTIRDNVRKAYDSMAEHYLEWTHASHGTRLGYIQRLLDLLESQHKDQTPPQQTLHALELGCGAGVPGTQFLISKGISVTANDISSAQISLARTHLPSSVTLIEGDMMDLEFPAAQFDCVIALYSIFHLPRDDQRTMLQRIRGWLKPGGLFLGSFAAGELEEKEKAWLGATDGVMHWAGWGVEQTCAVFGELGWEVLVKEVKTEIEDGKAIPFLWVMAR